MNENYQEIARFQKEEEFQSWFKTEINNDFWTRRWKHEGVRYNIEGYICRYSRRQGNLCKVIVKIKQNVQTDERIILQRGEHQHQIESTSGFTSEERQFMRTKVEGKLTGGQIQDAFLVFC